MSALLPIIITLFVTAPILALCTWLYLRRRTFTPRIRINLMLGLFLFVLFSGPVIYWFFQREGVSREIASAGRRGGQFLGQFLIVWLMGVFGIGAQLFRLWRKKGEL